MVSKNYVGLERRKRSDSSCVVVFLATKHVAMGSLIVCDPQTYSIIVNHLISTGCVLFIGVCVCHVEVLTLTALQYREQT